MVEPFESMTLAWGRNGDAESMNGLGRDKERMGHLFDDGKNPRLIVVVSVGSRTNVHLLGEGAFVVCSYELEDTAARRALVHQE
jgi:hypothetical protein